MSLSRQPLTDVPLDDLAWIAGSWRGSVGGDSVEEVWSHPQAGSMMGMFRWFRNDLVRFYEIIVLEASASGIAMRLRHFSPGPGLSAWESDEPMTLLLTELAGAKATFYDGHSTWLIYENEGDRMTVRFESSEGKPPVTEQFLLSRS